MAGEGLVSMTPTSITHSGTSATINADGGVDVVSVTSISINGVFTSSYDNYLIVINHTGSANENIQLRLRSSGVDALGSDYTRQYLFVGSTTVQGERLTSQTQATVGRVAASGYGGEQIAMYAPALAIPTAMRQINVNSISGASIETENVCTHSLSTAYDGFTIFLAASNTITGTIHVFGYEE